MAESISQKLNRFYTYILKDKKEGDKDSRFKSWEYCHKVFLNYWNKFKENNYLSDEDIDYLSLHLAFYLASWGMYRGSSYLLQRDYKTHKKAISLIMHKKYELLWDYEPTETNIEDAYNLLFDSKDGIYNKIKESYQGLDEEKTNDDQASETLVTKILLGTFGCIPAFDSMLREGIKYYCKKQNDNNYITIIVNNEECKLSSRIVKANGNGFTNTFKALSKWVVFNRKNLTFNFNEIYPVMKCVDMYFWLVGYEQNIKEELQKLDENDKETKKKENLINKANSIGYSSVEDSPSIIVNKIEKTNN